jgi:tetratricopeptide (TPR) repeat protein
LAPLYERVAEERREDLRAKVEKHLESARQLAAAGDFPAALAAVQRARRIDPESPAAASALAEVEAARQRREQAEEASRRQTEAKRRRQIARDVKKIEERLDRGDPDGAEKLLEKAGAPVEEDDPFAPLRERLAAVRRAGRRAQALAAAVGEIRGALDREELEVAGRLLDLAVVRFGAADPLREQWERLERARHDRKEKASAAATEIEGVFEAAQEIADLLSRREVRQALEALNAAAARFGERGEFIELRKRIATLLPAE